ncbi:hypothetical protein IQ260_07445 [Leptolyngbya cf. ectocarpi LEGE 11479]|uniref:DUF8201 domain-containing protein n=1 Tax=Leptolyngbya cf. ectocarpi LEGE 11479 TaxID=1828722 RepID=A0A928X2Q9_LEPEC|nr:hypothetical protein [Leptolyngbya ectocarpi]MBE9066484.1 hypothetical protein [Leptolyngbya cf. ectocarpi LEGE 11479]
MSFITGIGILNLFRIDEFNRVGDRFFISSWLGLVIIANGFLSLSLFVPLSPLVGLAALISITSLCLNFPNVRKDVASILLRVPDRWLLTAGCIAMVTALFTSQQVTWFDTGLYHFGSIRWMADYGAVPGLALLNNGFAFISAWFALAAPLNPDFMGSRNTAILNGYLLFVLLLQTSISIHYVFIKTATKTDWFLVIYSFLTLPLFVVTPFLSAVLVSPSPDFPVILLTGIVAWTIVYPLKLPSQASTIKDFTGVRVDASLQESNAAIVTLILGLGTVTFKLNGLPVLGISSLYYIAHYWKKPISIFFGSGLTILLLSPMIIFGVITSGCPLYPSSFMCVSAPWTLSNQQAADALASINGWQSWFGSPSNDTNTWLWTFSQWLQLSHLNKAMLFLAAMAVPISVWGLRKAKQQGHGADVWIIALSLLGMGFIFSQAPLIRFGLGYFLLLPTLLLSTVCTQTVSQLSGKVHQSSISRIVLSSKARLSALFVVTVFLSSVRGINVSQQLMIPPELPGVTVNQIRVNDVDYFLPENTNKCWGVDLPCAPEPLESDIWLRNPQKGVAAGFQRKP